VRSRRGRRGPRGEGVVVESEHPGSGVGNVTLYVCKYEVAAKYMSESPVENRSHFKS